MTCGDQRWVEWCNSWGHVYWLSLPFYRCYHCDNFPLPKLWWKHELVIHDVTTFLKRNKFFVCISSVKLCHLLNRTFRIHFGFLSFEYLIRYGTESRHEPSCIFMSFTLHLFLNTRKYHVLLKLIWWLWCFVYSFRIMLFDDDMSPRSLN